jgi:hypothetical protein
LFADKILLGDEL